MKEAQIATKGRQPNPSPSNPDLDVAWKIVQATSNDNPQPVLYWLKRMIPWTIGVGTLLAYLLLT